MSWEAENKSTLERNFSLTSFESSLARNLDDEAEGEKRMSEKNYFKAARTFTIASKKSQKFWLLLIPRGKRAFSRRIRYTPISKITKELSKKKKKRVKHSCLDLSLVFWRLALLLSLIYDLFCIRGLLLLHLNVRWFIDFLGKAWSGESISKMGLK